MKCIVSSLLIGLILSFSSAALAQTIEERLNALENAVRSQAKIIEEQQKVIDSLKQQQKAKEPAAQGTEPEAPSAAAPQGEVDLRQKVEDLDQKVDQVVEAQKKEVPSVFNPAIGLVGETIFSYRSKGKTDTGSDRPGGFDVFQRSVELNVAASVDPFAKGYAVINATADPVTGEAALGVEEAALQTTSLPWNLEFKAGRFFGEFGRLAYIHDHELPFVNRPLALNQYIGGESRTDGLQLNWLVPIEHYVSLTVGAGNQFGGDNPPNDVGDFRHASGFNYWGRLSTSVGLTPDVTLEPGISALWNPKTRSQWAPETGIAFPADINANTFTERERRLYGADLTVSYKPLRDNQFRSLTWGTEILYSHNRYDVLDASGGALPGQTVGALGLYSYLTYKFHRQWAAGFEYDFVASAVDKHARTYAYSPNITWALSHWNQLRLQYTRTDNNASTGLRSDDAVYVQWSWIIGAHAHGWQQR